MKRVAVNASKRYEILIGDGLRFDVGKHISEAVKPCTAAIITDDIVDALYSADVENSLESAGFKTEKFVFPHGEKSKNLAVWGEILDFLAELKLTRKDIIVCVGGGVTGDMAGFAAASYLRGIRFVSMPTTFLAAVDSSVGGKTAVNLSAGKNLVGAFWQPELVLCDMETLNNLPDDIFADGAAEAIKSGIISDPRLFEIMKNENVRDNLEEIVERCVKMKADIVSRDEKEGGERQLLNLGHTIGHAIEKCSDFTISHGHAVAAGTAIVARAAKRRGLCSAETADSIIAALLANDLPTECQYTAEQLTSVALSDKKRSEGMITLVIPEKIGHCRLVPTPIEHLHDFIADGLK